MSKYGEAAVKAVDLIVRGVEDSPGAAWESAVEGIFPNSESARRKSCPRGAFLGLCEAGRVRDVLAGNYTLSKKNKDYALLALEFIEEDRNSIDDKKLLWSKVTDGISRVSNHQMEVVLALLQNDLILPKQS